ncbi:ABC transporter permease [Microbacterium sp. A196]|uniref:ABC transporter permease n=1 Tax=Microbacterium sp. A196 TaxID=3457320 RepID=UPI003FD16D37
MGRFIIVRALMALTTVVVVTMIAFLLVHAMPGSPGAVALGTSATEDAIHAFNERIGWYDPLPLQYLTWAADALRGDFGTSHSDSRSVAADLLTRLPVTTALAAGATLLSAIIGVVIGVIAAVRGGIVDKAVGGVTGVAAALPPFWVGILLVFALAVQIRVFPATGYVDFATSPSEWFRSLTLPVLTLAVGSSAFIARQTRASMLDALTQEHIRTLRATATPTWRILFVHALRFASLPIVAQVAIQFIVLFGGSVVIESLFVLPGLGQAVQRAVNANDAPMILGIVTVATLVVVIVNLLLELANKVLDPKLRAA